MEVVPTAVKRKRNENRTNNNLDVAPGLKALEKNAAFHTKKGINILKDAVSIPGVNLHYLLQGAVE